MSRPNQTTIHTAYSMNTTSLHSLTAFATFLCLSQTASAVVLAGSNNGNANLHAIAWQTFDNAGAANNTGINDSTPDSNSSFDSTPVGSNSGGYYLVGGLGAASGSALGRQGFGQAATSSFLQSPRIGLTVASGGLNILDIPDAGVDGLSGTLGTQQNMQGSSGSSWKFRTNNNQGFGDFSLTNASDYAFRLERVHYDARSGNSNSPSTLDFIYLAGTSNLTRADNGNEIADLAVVKTNNFATAPSSTKNSVSLAGRFGTAVRLAPGDTATFRFRWTDSITPFAEAQIDNLGFSGTFQDQNNGFALIDPAAVVVPEPSGVILLAFAAGFGLVKRRR